MRRTPFVTLLSVNGRNQPGTRCQWAPAGQGEFKKPVYESKFTKCPKGMSFVNSKPGTLPGLGKQDFKGSGEVPKVSPSSGNRPLT